VSISDQHHAVNLLSRLNRLEHLQTVIAEVDIIGLTNVEKATLEGIIKSCCLVLDELEKKLDQYEGVDTIPHDMKSSLRKVHHRFKWDERKIESFRSRIQSNLASLSAFNLNRIR
jgi:ribosome-associated translation inhibitor RaiA